MWVGRRVDTVINKYYFFVSRSACNAIKLKEIIKQHKIYLFICFVTTLVYFHSCLCVTACEIDNISPSKARRWEREKLFTVHTEAKFAHNISMPKCVAFELIKKKERRCRDKLETRVSGKLSGGEVRASSLIDLCFVLSMTDIQRFSF